MKAVVDGFFISFSMYSAIPVKRETEWNKDTMKYALCFLPFIGLLIGLLEFFLLRISLFFGFEKCLYSACAAVVPIFVSGGIHTDGFIDTLDAYFSFSDRKKRLEIMHDPHIGAFGLICFGCFILLLFGAFCQIYMKPKYSVFIIFVFVLSRTFGAFMLTCVECAEGSSLAKIFCENADKSTVKAVLLMIFTAAVTAGIIFIGIKSAVIPFLLFFFYKVYIKSVISKFGGVTGDLAGCFITLSELFMIFICSIGGVLC